VNCHQQETQKRLEISRQFNEKMKKRTLGIILVGSVAYAPNTDVTEKSDLDLVVVYEDLNDCVDTYFDDARERKHIKNSPYDGVLVKSEISGVAVSIHNISLVALKKIVNADQKHLKYYRQKAKDTIYHSIDFNGKSHPFKVENIVQHGVEGVQRLDPISFQKEGNFVIGNDIDKLLSGAIVTHDKMGKIEAAIASLWSNLVDKLIEHQVKKGASYDLDQLDMNHYLCRKDRFCKTVRDNITSKTRMIAQHKKTGA